MGTRSLTFVHEGTMVKPFVCMYRQMDGYPSGHGKDLYEFLKPIKMVNGFGADTDGVKQANGPGCLAAQMVANFKDGVGGIYLQPVTGTDCGQDYNYHVYADEGGIIVKCFKVRANNRKELLFHGTVEEFGAFCTEDDS